MSNDPERRSPDEDSIPVKVTRIVEMRVRLEWVLTGILAISWALVSMYFSVGTLVKTVSDLQIDVKAGNNSVVAVAGELALLKYRLTNAETSIDRMAESVKKGGK